MNKLFSKEEFKEQLKFLESYNETNFQYLYDVYSATYEGLLEISKARQAGTSFEINNSSLIYYILGEFLYSTRGFKSEDIQKFIKNEKIKDTMCDVVADKYISLLIYNHQEQRLTNKYFPPISSIELYVNLMLNILNKGQVKDQNNALLIDFLNKTLSIARCILNQLCEGYETEAFALWRTLHECECVLILLDKYKEAVIPTYIKHMQYSLIFRQGETDIELNNQVFAKIKEEMKALDLKSKDTKKYIEYGWLLAIPGVNEVPNFKLNFRDGVETLAGLHSYSEIYTTSSEILHGSPMLIYSNKTYFHLLTLINLYESFFRIEKVFESLFFPKINQDAKEKYLEMKKMYFSHLIAIHKRELDNFNNYVIKKQNKA